MSWGSHFAHQDSSDHPLDTAQAELHRDVASLGKVRGARISRKYVWALSTGNPCGGQRVWSQSGVQWLHWAALIWGICLVQIREARGLCKLLRGTMPWLPLPFPLARVPRRLAGRQEGPRNLPRCLSQPPIHRKPACQPSCPPMPAQRCQGTRRSKASWQLRRALPPGRPICSRCQLHACGRRSAALPSGRGASRWALRASWQAGSSGHCAHLLAGAR